MLLREETRVRVETCADGDLSSDDSITTVKVGLIVVEMHGATLALGHSGNFAHLLSDDSLERFNGRFARHLRIASILRRMATVGSDEVIISTSHHFHTNLNGLLTIVTVTNSIVSYDEISD